MKKFASSLYDWFDEQAKADMPFVARIGCCQQVVSSLGTLAGLGIPRATISAFVDKTLDSIDRMMSVVQGDRSTGENIDAVLDEAAREEAATPAAREAGFRRRGLLRICQNCQPPTGIEQPSLGILAAYCDVCGEPGDGTTITPFRLHDILGRLASLEARCAKN